MNEQNFDEVVGDDLSPSERARLQRAHDLLLAAGPMPELPPELEEPVKPPAADIIPYFPKRRYAAATVAAAAAIAVAFGAGYLFGHRQSPTFTADRKVRMHATQAQPGALASIQIGKHDDNGNWQLLVKLSGLRELPKGGYYALWLTRNGKPVAPCGWFRAHGNNVSVRLTVAYALKQFDGWELTRQDPGRHVAGPVVLTT